MSVPMNFYSSLWDRMGDPWVLGRPGNGLTVPLGPRNGGHMRKSERLPLSGRSVHSR